MSEPSPPRHSSRETRLLLLTLAVSVAALLLLARFRFPERPLTDLSTPQPLTRLTRVTAFDELSAMLRDLLRQFEGAVVLARVTPAGESGGGNGRGNADATRLADQRGLPGDALGLLVRDDLALVPLAPGARVEAVAGSPVPVNGIVARDEQRGLAVVRVPGYTAPEISLQPAATPIDAPGYVAILEAAPDGPTIRAEFVSRYSTESHAGWDQPVLALSGPSTAKPGSLLFTLSGRFVGMTLADSGRLLVVPATVLMARAMRLADGENVVSVESGIEVQAMTPSIARAAGAAEGVVVSSVSPAAESSVMASASGAGGAGAANGSSSTPLRNGAAHISMGDVITTAADRPVRAPRDWQQILRAQAAGATIKLTIVRFGKPLQATLTLPRTEVAAPADAAAPAPSRFDAMGLTLRNVTGGSEVIAVRPASPAARAGLRTTDTIAGLPGRPQSQASASPGGIAVAWAELASGQALMLAVVARDGTPRITAIEKP